MSNAEIENIKKEGVLIALGGSNWDYYFKNNIVWSIPKTGSGCGASVWCGVSNLKKHLNSLRRIKGDALIPDEWQIVNRDFFVNLGII